MRVLAKAKINLTLDVLHKRSDGYHEVEMVMQSLELSDAIDLSVRSDAAIRLQVAGADLPADHSNLAYRAAELLQRTCCVTNGADIVLEKKIPLAAGLAGGSADAAAVLWGLNRLWKLDLPQSELERLGAQIGSDVPFCLRGGTVLARGRGEQLSDLPTMPECAVVLVKLPIAVPTAWVYGRFRAADTVRHPDTPGMLKALTGGVVEEIAACVENVLESVTVDAYPQIAEVKEELVARGALAVLMSGSGPTVFALAKDEEQARSLAAGLAERWQADVFVTKTSKVGCEDGRAAFVAD